MRFTSHKYFALTAWQVGIATVLAGCASVAPQQSLNVEPAKVAERLGLHGCRVSVPLTTQEVLDDARRSGNPAPEKNDDWRKITEELRPGDELREVNCSAVPEQRKRRAPVYYALVRDGVVLLRFVPMILD